MRILPVIDLKSGVVVRGVAGNRETYAPIESALTPDSSPAAVAQALVDSLSATEVYVADLDAIAGASPDYESYQQIAAAGLRIWLDAGTGRLEKVNSLSQGREGEFAPHRLIIGLESLTGADALKRIVEAVDPSQLAFSLDMKNGRPLTACDDWAQHTPAQVAKLVINAGVRRLIVLDLADVGVGGGTQTLALCRQIRDDFADIELIAGGGVRTLDDLSALANVGVDVALVASAIHEGEITSVQFH